MLVIGAAYFAIPATALAGPALAADINAGKAIVMQGNGKAPACMSCHAQTAPNATANFPRLSGLDGAYIAKQIADYKKGSRINAAMQPIATALTEKEAGDVGAYYASQRVEAVAPPASAEQMALGEKLATRGNWVKEIPACFSCHARGARASVLSLRLPDNTQATASDRSTHGRTARENDPVGLMKGIAERLSDEETAAVSAYLATLKSRK